jgi:hypothetical protein
LKYKTLHNTAKQIDQLIDHHLHANVTSVFPQEQLKSTVTKNFPDLYVINIGWHKIIFGIHSIDQEIVLKVGPKNSIENDHRAYKRFPENMRHKLFAKIFWHTKYCLLQEYGFSAHVTPEELTRLRRIVNRYGIFDIKAENIKCIDGELKIIDANVTSIPIPFVLRKIDEVKPMLPRKLILFFKTITKTLFEK